MQKPLKPTKAGVSETINFNEEIVDQNLPQVNQDSVVFPKCLECGDRTRLNVVKNPRGIKWLRCGICDLALRKCPDPDQLSKSPRFSTQEREYCSKVANLAWFSGQVAAVLLSLEAKAAKAGEDMNHG